MLQQISWSSYFIFLGLGTVVYYGWWLVRFFPGLPSRRPGATSPQPEKLSNPQPLQPASVTIVTNPDPPTPKPILPPSTKKPIFLPTMAANLRQAISQLLEKAASESLTQSEIIASLHHLLTSDPHRNLRSTPYEEKINTLLLQEWGKYGSAPDDPAVFTGLWQD